MPHHATRAIPQFYPWNWRRAVPQRLFTRAAAGFLLLAAAAPAADRKARVYDAPFEPVWKAAAAVASEAFLRDTRVREEGRLRFRTGPLRSYGFEALVKPETQSRTRVELRLRSLAGPPPKSAWREGEHYLDLVARKLEPVRRR